MTQQDTKINEHMKNPPNKQKYLKKTCALEVGCFKLQSNSLPKTFDTLTKPSQWKSRLYNTMKEKNQAHNYHIRTSGKIKKKEKFYLNNIS